MFPLSNTTHSDNNVTLNSLMVTKLCCLGLSSYNTLLEKKVTASENWKIPVHNHPPEEDFFLEAIPYFHFCRNVPGTNYEWYGSLNS